VQSDDQPGRKSGAADVLHEQLPELGVKERPVDLTGKLEQRVPVVENLVQARLEQIALSLLGGQIFLLHKITSF